VGKMVDRATNNIAFIDIEGHPDSDSFNFGISVNDSARQSTSVQDIADVLQSEQINFICGHNFIDFDYQIVRKTSLFHIIERRTIKMLLVRLSKGGQLMTQ
jgi:ATP-dependent DNA helicase RecQ